MVRRSGRAPGRRLDAGLRQQPLPAPRRRPRRAGCARASVALTSSSRMSAIGRSSARPSGLKTMTSSMRLMNSGLKVRAQLAEDLLLDALEAVVLALAEAHAAAAQHQLGADVGGHEDQRVLEVDLVAVGVGEHAVLEDLQQQVGDVGVRLLDLVEQDQRVGLAADALGELAALLVADVARRRADQLGDGVLLHVLATCRSGPAPSGCRRGTRRAGAPPRSCPRPTGPRKMNEPTGRCGLLTPRRERRIARRDRRDGARPGRRCGGAGCPPCGAASRPPRISRRDDRDAGPGGDDLLDVAAR